MPFLKFLLFLPPLWAFGALLPQLPPGEFADTEVTAYESLSLPSRNARGLDLSLAFNGTASNNVEIALGRDADGDGRLSHAETGLTLGWDCGRYFVECVATGERYEELAASGGDQRRLFWHCPMKRGRLLGVTVSNEMDVVFASFATNVPVWAYSADWNLMRLTARGVDAPGERFVVTPLATGFLVDLK